MSNPWSQAYEELRKPYLEGKMAKKDYDGDGKIESGTDEYMGSRDKAIKKAMGKKIAKEHHQKDADGNVIPHGDGTPSSVEEEEINELSKTTTANYLYQAKVDKGYVHGGKMGKYAKARDKGIKRAEKKLGSKISKKVSDDASTDTQSMRRDTNTSKFPRTYKVKEGAEQIDELSIKTLDSYARKASKDLQRPDKKTYGKGNKFDRTKSMLKAADKISKKQVDGVKEDAEQIDELSKKTLGSYAHKALKDVKYYKKAKKVVGDSPYVDKKIDQRNKGMDLALKKMGKKEEVEINPSVQQAVQVLDELSKRTLGGYIKKASKETRGNMVATQHGSGIPKKARDIKQKQVFKRLKGMEKAGEKMSKEETVNEISMPKNTSYEKMSYKKLKNTHGDFKNMDSKPPRVAVLDKKTGGTVSKPVKFVPDKKPKSKMKEEFDFIENSPLAEATLGTLHVADMAANTVAWQNRYDTNHKGERLYDFGQDLINAMAEYVDEAKDTSAMKKYLDAKAKKLTKEKEAQKPEYKNNPAFGDPSHHSNRKNRKEAFSDWRSDFIWEDGDSVKKT